MLLYVHRNRRLIRDGSPGRPPRLSHTAPELCLVCKTLVFLSVSVERHLLVLSICFRARKVCGVARQTAHSERALVTQRDVSQANMKSLLSLIFAIDVKVSVFFFSSFHNIIS